MLSGVPELMKAVIWRKNTCVRQVSLIVSYSANSYGFDVNESTIHIKEGVFKEKHT